MPAIQWKLFFVNSINKVRDDTAGNFTLYEQSIFKEHCSPDQEKNSTLIF